MEMNNMETQQGKNIIKTAVIAFLEKAGQPYELSLDSYQLTTSINFENVIYNIEIKENKTRPVISIWYTFLLCAQSLEKMTLIVNELNCLGPGKFVYSETGAINFGWDFLMPSYDISADEFGKYFEASLTYIYIVYDVLQRVNYNPELNLGEAMAKNISRIEEYTANGNNHSLSNHLKKFENETPEMNPKLASDLENIVRKKSRKQSLIDEWILITYDIPATEKGKAARQQFQKTARKIGAVMHSRSVYLMPNTPQARLNSGELSKIIGAKVCIWPSKVEEKIAVRLTAFYDGKIKEKIKCIEDRITREAVLVKGEKFGMASRMHRKTANLLAQLWFTVEQRGAPGQVIKKINQIENTFNGKK